MANLKRMGMGKLGLEPQIQEEAEMLMEHLEATGVVNPSQLHLLQHHANDVSSEMEVWRSYQQGVHQCHQHNDHKNANCDARGFRCNVQTPPKCEKALSHLQN